MDYGLGLVQALLREGPPGVRRARERGIQPDYFDDTNQKLLGFVYDYVAQNQVLPTPELIEQSTGLIVNDPINGPPEGTVDFYIQYTLDARLHLQLQEGLGEAAEHLKQRAPHDALKTVQQTIREANRQLLTASPISTAADLGDIIIREYEETEAGKRGVLTPWPSINEETYGLKPPDLFLMVARLGRGKTWLATSMCAHAWLKEHRRVLFATTEMSKARIYQRLCAIHLRLPYDDLRKGRLDAFSKKRFYEGVEALKTREGLHIVGGDFDFRVESFVAAIEDVAPELVILDGAYLLKVDGATRTEQMANAWNEIKRAAHQTHCPFFVTMQFNRDVKGNKADHMSPESVALSDVAGWNADVMYGLYQTDEMKKAKRAGLKPLKLREGAGITDIEINFDFDTMDFSEINAPTGGIGLGDADTDSGMGAVVADPGPGDAAEPGVAPGAPDDPGTFNDLF